jgi:molybdopterin-guanine dinucleotide biosynthesis protein B
VEGFKQEPIPKIEVYRPNLNKPMLATHDPHIVAIAADAQVATDLPLLDLNDPNAIADFIMQWLKQQRANLKLVSSR